MGNLHIEFRLNSNYLNKDKNFICSVKRGDIINIKSEYTENLITGDDTYVDRDGYLRSLPYSFVNDEDSKYFLHLATLTFLFKEMSFPDISYLDPL